MEKIKTTKPEVNSLLSYYGFTKAEQRKYPVVTGVLKQLTSERVKKEIEEVKKVELPVEIQKWVDEYEKVGKRNRFLWKWLYRMFKIVHLPYIPKSIELKLLDIKLLFTMFITLLDDVADRNGDRRLLKYLLEIPFQKEEFGGPDNLGLNIEDENCLKLCRQLWNRILVLIKKDLVNYKQYEEIFEFDLFQALNEMRYAYILNKYPNLINKNEYWIFLTYNMCLYVYSDMDLMSCPDFNIKKLGRVRELVWEIQKTARIGNWLSTWQRELKENDFSSIIFAYFFEKKEFNFSDKLSNEKYSRITKDIRNQKIEKAIFIEWEKSYNKIRMDGSVDKSLKMNKILNFSRELIFLHLANSGHI